MCPDNAAPDNPAGARCVCGGRGKVVEQQIGALGNPCSPFSSSFPLLCIRRGFDKNPIVGSAVHTVFRMCAVFITNYLGIMYFITHFNGDLINCFTYLASDVPICVRRGERRMGLRMMTHVLQNWRTDQRPLPTRPALKTIIYVEVQFNGQCHEIFCFRFFSRITFTQAPENNSRVISNIFEKFAELFAS
jgi:hypothetical protein